MRLLNTETFELKEFYSNVPIYAILSHTWGEEEVTFQDIQDLNIAKRRSGWSKVRGACAHARKYDFEWIWIDSCCIDKSSSAELSEAINSMYQYYEDATVCYVHLCDARSAQDPRDPISGFRNSRWFTRGWTLQELIAPVYIVFLDNNWTEIGTRWSLRDAISAVTAIPVKLFESCDLSQYSIAQKMSWAAFRETTRPEDQAYCLMGIFGVCMPPIYGEGGEKAFMRLQQEIIKISDDRSIFAWVSDSKEYEVFCSEFGSPQELRARLARNPAMGRGLLARSPVEFRASGGVGVSQTNSIGINSSFSFTNNGLRIHLLIVPTGDPRLGEDTGVYLASLNCRSDGHECYIYVLKTDDQRYVRCLPNELVLVSSSASPENLQEVVVKEVTFPRMTKRSSSLGKNIMFKIRLLPPAQHTLTLVSYDKDYTFGHARALPDDSTLSMALHSWLEYTLHQTYVRCKVQTTGELFCIVLGIHGGIDTVSVVPHGSSSAENFLMYTPPTDRSTIELESGGLVSAGLQMTGLQSETQRVLEISYKLCDDTTKMVTLHPPSLGFLAVPMSQTFLLDKEPCSLVDVFPLDFFDRGLKSSQSCEIYLFMPTREHVNAFRVLTYRSDNMMLYVTVGFHETRKTWVDVIVCKNADETPEEIWKSYLENGSRAFKQKNSTSYSGVEVETTTRAHQGYEEITKSIIAGSVVENATQLGPHSFLLKLGSYYQTYELDDDSDPEF
ncbi:hypothetical protein VKT23_014922 [Stygiomarasmius scandens]|uniref:HET-domain-containing protein n=1 Tax=Marasmiellus scandens TaxID=2682957 RepID=A0ABR1IU62_9AGAR